MSPARGRPVRQRATRGRSLTGERFAVDVGPVAHGGHCIARHEGRVVFVRHSLPGERVIVEVTEGSEEDRFLRADAIQVLSASPARVAPPCPYAGPNLCGGCDFQHVDLGVQRQLKAAVVREQLRRLAGLELPVEVEAVPGDAHGLRWRTRMQWAFTEDGRRGLRKHRSHDVVPVQECPIAAPDARDADTDDVVTEQVLGHAFGVDAAGFWQVHPGAPATLVAAVLAGLEPRPGERAVDLYAGVGLFSLFLADAVGPTGHVLAVEGAAAAAEHARANLRARPWASVRTASAEQGIRTLDRTDLVVLDPPREGARRRVVEAVAALEPRRIAYVACDPASLARDLATFSESGFGLRSLRAFDLFPMTHHVECVALLSKTGSDLR